MKRFYLYILCFFCAQTISPVDILVFSKDRPLQLYAFLESLFEHAVDGLDSVNVLYHAQDDRFDNGYACVKECFSTVTFIEQNRTNPQGDFQSLVKHFLRSTESEYIVFAVDDIIVTRDIDFAYDQALLEQTDAYGLYYRLGKNITYCYARDQISSVPSLSCVDDDVYSYRLSSGSCDWGYPNTVDMTLYKKNQISSTLSRLHYFSPNSMEGAWAGCARLVLHKKALVYRWSKIINVPLNLVQKDAKTQGNRCMHLYTPDELLQIFEAGYKIDIHAAQKVENCSAHVEWEPVFVER